MINTVMRRAKPEVIVAAVKARAAGADEQQWGRAAEILGVAPAFLRSLDTAGLIAPQRTRQLSCGVSSLPSDQQGASNRTRGNRP